MPQSGSDIVLIAATALGRVIRRRVTHAQEDESQATVGEQGEDRQGSSTGAFDQEEAFAGLRSAPEPRSLRHSP